VVANLEIIITAARADKLDCEPHLRWGIMRKFINELMRKKESPGSPGQVRVVPK
jgi:hypothetical protein